MNKRQRKKRRRDVHKDAIAKLITDAEFAAGTRGMAYSVVADITSWDASPWKWSYISKWLQTGRGLPSSYICGLGFGRCFDGDATRFNLPSPYLPDGQENPAYAAWIEDDQSHG